jgi:hypothetical protein
MGYSMYAGEAHSGDYADVGSSYDPYNDSYYSRDYREGAGGGYIHFSADERPARTTSAKKKPAKEKKEKK